MTPQSELTRLLGIPPELWEGELKGMSDEELRWFINGIPGNQPIPFTRAVFDEVMRRTKQKESQP